MHSWAVEDALTSRSEGRKEGILGAERFWGRVKWVALWEWAQGMKIFVKHPNVPQEAATTGEALNHQADTMTQPVDTSESLTG